MASASGACQSRSLRRKRGMSGGVRTTLFGALALATVAAGASAAPTRPDLALHRPYQWNRPPDYPLTTDPGDAQQLTDGVSATVTPLWKDKATVGWGPALSKFVSITIDLGDARAVDEVTYSTGAGTANVHWPHKLLLYLSDDAKTWDFAGDIVRRDVDPPPPEPASYLRHRFRAAQLASHGRFVRIVIVYRFYAFCDEIEVFGPDGSGAPRATAAVRPAGSSRTRDPERHAWRLDRDGAYIAAVQSRFPETPEAAAVKAELSALAAKLAQDPPAPPRGGRAVLPLDDDQRRLFAINGKALAARGLPKLFAWKVNRYDPIGPLDVATDAQRKDVSLRLRAMPGERRGDAVVLTNASDQKQRIHLRLTGIPADRNPAVFEVPFVETTSGDVADALVEARREPGGWSVDVDAGMNRELWISIQPVRETKPGDLPDASLLATSAGAPQLEVPIRSRISRVPLARPRLHLGGWDYTDGATAYDVVADNREQLVRFLQAHLVDVTWAHRATLPEPADFRDRGAQRSRDRFAALDGWIARWPQARARFVYLAVQDDLSGARRGTPEFEALVAGWMKDAAAYVTQKAAGALFGVLSVDEPATPQQASRIEDWAGAIRKATPRPLVYEDPVSPNPSSFKPMLDACDILSPPWMRYLALPAEERAVLAPTGSRQLWLYETKGPVRAMDPVSYHRLASWVAFRERAQGIQFWSFAEAGGGSSWNEYESSKGAGFAPEYLDRSGVTDSKHMTAIEEGLYDHERLSLLADRVAQLEARGGGSPVIAKARAFLTAGPQRVLAGLDRAADSETLWATPKDRSVADAVADEALDLLESLDAVR